MKKLILNILITIFTLSSSVLMAQSKVLSNGENSQRLLSSEENGFTVELQLQQFELEQIEEGKETYFSMRAEGYGENQSVGAPNLPVYHELIEIPTGAEYEISVNVLEEKTYQLADKGITSFLYPKQQSLEKRNDVVRTFMMDKTIYTSNKDYNPVAPGIHLMGNMRGQQIGRLEYAPVSYNPVKNTLHVVSKAQISVHFTNFDARKYQVEKEKFYSPAFASLSDELMNANAYRLVPPTGVTFPLSYVIVADSMFSDSLQPFIEWKTKQGYKIIEAYLQNPGVGYTASDIKTYLQGLYNASTAQNPAPSYVLFVGDVAQLPSNNGTASPSNHISDMLYCEFTNDYLPEMHFGRFSANNQTELSAQIRKTLVYEQYLMNDPGYLSASVLIAGQDSRFGPVHGDGQINYIHNNYFTAANNITPSVYLHSVSGNSETQIIQDINNGAAIVNYTAHGSWQGWVDPAFSVSDANGLTNANKYPVMIGNACETNRFEKTICIGEALLRGQDKGAVAYIGASNNTLWDEDFYWAVGITSNITANPTYAGTDIAAYDKMFHSHNEAAASWGRTVTDFITKGNLSVSQSGSTSSDYYWEIYHVMGDPSLMPYFYVPTTLNVSYVPLLPVGASSYSVTTEAFALVALSANGQLIASAMADSLGTATLSFPALSTAGNVDLLVTAHNKQPWSTQLTIANPTGPYVIYKAHAIDDAVANNNQHADYGESIDLDIEIQNITSFDANGLQMTLRTTDTFIQLTDSTYSWSQLNGNSDTNLTAAFSFNVDSLVPDRHVVRFDLVITDNASNQWTSGFDQIVHAPDIEIGSYIIDDASQGNGNGRLDPGEQAEIRVMISNLGHADIGSSLVSLTTNFNGLTIPNNFTFNQIQKRNDGWAAFPVQVASNATIGKVISLDCTFEHGPIQKSKGMVAVVGSVDEDFETGDYTKFNWTMGGQTNWVLSTQTVFEGTYSALAENVDDTESASFEISLNVLQDDSISFIRKVSSEEDYDFLNFYIDGQIVDQWSGDQDWKRVSYAVTSGMHTFKWEYDKDYYQAGNDDKAWIDFIRFPVTDVWSGITQTDNNAAISLYPNPAKDEVNIAFTLESTEDFTVHVYNLAGQIQHESELRSNSGQTLISIPVKHLQKGVYFVQLRSEHHTFTRRFMVIN